MGWRGRLPQAPGRILLALHKRQPGETDVVRPRSGGIAFGRKKDHTRYGRDGPDTMVLAERTHHKARPLCNSAYVKHPEKANL